MRAVGRISASAMLASFRYLLTVLWLIRNMAPCSASGRPFFLWASDSRRKCRMYSLHRFPGCDAFASSSQNRRARPLDATHCPTIWHR